VKPLNPRRASTKAVDLNASRVETEAATGGDRVKILLYGRLVDGIGREIELDGPSRTIGDLRHKLIERHPAAADILRRSRAVIADSLVGDDEPIHEPDIVELLPPVCGG
jgi:molybdopterin converting factor small subunit